MLDLIAFCHVQHTQVRFLPMTGVNFRTEFSALVLPSLCPAGNSGVIEVSLPDIDPNDHGEEKLAGWLFIRRTKNQPKAGKRLKFSLSFQGIQRARLGLPKLKSLP